MSPSGLALSPSRRPSLRSGQAFSARTIIRNRGNSKDNNAMFRAMLVRERSETR